MSTATVAEVSVLNTRLELARDAASQAGVDALIVGPGSDLRYLLGAVGQSFERLTCLVLPAAGSSVTPTLLVPRLEWPGYAGIPLDQLDVAAVTWTDNENPYQLTHDLLGGKGHQARTVAVTDMLPALHVLGLRDVAPEVNQVLAGPVLRNLRMRKDAEEIASLRRAGAAIDRVHARMGEWLKPGRTEAAVGADIAAAIVEEGHVTVEFVIVGAGPHGASPHHEVSERVLEPGDVVVVDIGGALADGYNSDSTRTYVLGEPSQADVLATYAVLQQAQQAALDAVRPGVTAESIDEAARHIIADAGFGEYFVHRTGHGIGLDVHEEPYIGEGNQLLLEPGMAFSVEPGIYLPSRWGARIEDIVVVTEDGVSLLNNRPRNLVAL